MRLIISLSLLVIVAATGLASAETGGRSLSKEPFHVAQSDAEKALDEVLRGNNQNRNMHYYLLGTPWYDAKKDTGYSRMFTKNFLQALAKAESDLIKLEPGGKCVEGDLCGFDYDPIDCSQEGSDDGYLYRTIEDDGHKAIILCLWVGYDPDKAETFYKLIKVDDHWKLDGIDCRRIGTKFNMD